MALYMFTVNVIAKHVQYYEYTSILLVSILYAKVLLLYLPFSILTHLPHIIQTYKYMLAPMLIYVYLAHNWLPVRFY